MRSVTHIVPTWQNTARQRGRNAALWALCGRRVTRRTDTDDTERGRLCPICARKAGRATDRRSSR